MSGGGGGGHFLQGDSINSNSIVVYYVPTTVLSGRNILPVCSAAHLYMYIWYVFV